MTLEVAFNFDNSSPEILKFENPPSRVFESRERFIAFITQGIDVLDVWNASCCVYTNGKAWQAPTWYNGCNGKVFFEQQPEAPEPAFEY